MQSVVTMIIGRAQVNLRAGEQNSQNIRSVQSGAFMFNNAHQCGPIFFVPRRGEQSGPFSFLVQEAQGIAPFLERTAFFAANPLKEFPLPGLALRIAWIRRRRPLGE